jgi:hypothetical protein
MKKIILCFGIILLLFSSANAQSGSTKNDDEFKLDVGPMAAVPLGMYGKETSFGLGAFVKGAYNVAPNLDATLHIGFTTFWGKSYGGIKLANDHLFNALAGGSYTFFEGLHGDAGVGFALQTGDPGFQFRVGAGYRMENGLDFTVNYNGLHAAQETSGYIGVGVSYTIFQK